MNFNQKFRMFFYCNFRLFFFFHSISFLQIALSSFYETNQDTEIQDDDNNATGATSSQPIQVPASLFGTSNDQEKNAKKDKSKNKYNIGGARIVTLHNMSSSDDDDDESSGQVSFVF